jgi:hypothetical protein
VEGLQPLQAIERETSEVERRLETFFESALAD